jgi:hypothetical protein
MGDGIKDVVGDVFPALLLAMLIIVCSEIFIVLVEYLPQGRIGGFSRVIDWRDGSHKSYFAEHADKLFLCAWAGSSPRHTPLNSGWTRVWPPPESFP